MVKRSAIIGFVLMTTCFFSFPVFAQGRGAPSRTNPTRDSGRHNPTISEPVSVTPDKTVATDEYLKEEFGALVKFDRVREEIATQISRKNFSEADFLITTLKADIKNSILSEAQKNKLLAEIERNESVEFFSKQGEYKLAANAIIRAMKLNKDSADFDNLKTMFEKISAQRKVFEIKIDIEKQGKKLAETKQALLKEKLTILKKMNTGKKLADKELKRLQASLKTIDEKLRRLEEEVRLLSRCCYMPEIGLKLGKEFDRQVSICLESRLAVERDNKELEKQIVKHLTEIGESSEITWKNLREDIIELGNLLNKTFRLRGRLELFAKKANLTDSELSEVSLIKAQLEKAIQNREDQLNAIENTFINQEVFEKLTGSEIKELFSRMRGFWIKQRIFDSLEPSLKELYKAFVVADSSIEQPGVPEFENPDTDADIQGTGRILQLSEGFMLVFRGEKLDPNNLPTKYRKNDLEVAFAANYVNNRKAYIEKYPEINLVFISAKSDEYIMRPGELVKPRIGPDEVIIPGCEVRPIQIRKQDQGQDQDKPANLMNSF